LLPGAIAIVSPLIIGFGLGAEVLGGFLAGATVSGVLMGMFQNNAGGAWDNAKKSFESGVEINGEVYYKKSEPHKASVTGDTVGDPFKDTSGPSMNILIKLMSIVSLVIAPTLSHMHTDKAKAAAPQERQIEVILTDSTSNITTIQGAAGQNTVVAIEEKKGTPMQLLDALKKAGYEKDGKLEVIYENGVLSVNGTALDSAATAPYRSMLPAEKTAKLVLRSK
jgi:K(+)-stimulated pyrophosphate-energized sodium pump